MLTLVAQNHWNLHLYSSLAELQKIPIFIDEIPPLRRLKEDKQYFLKLSLHELATNAIVHGNKLVSEKKVQINLQIERDKILVTISDEGSGFTKEVYDNIMRSDPTVKEGGRGLRLVKETMALVSLQSSNRKFSLTFEMIA